MKPRKHREHAPCDGSASNVAMIRTPPVGARDDRAATRRIAPTRSNRVSDNRWGAAASPSRCSQIEQTTLLAVLSTLREMFAVSLQRHAGGARRCLLRQHIEGVRSLSRRQANRDDSIADWRGSGQGLAALRDFDPAYRRFGSGSDYPSGAPMSASTSCGHAPRLAYRRYVPTADVSRCSKIVPIRLVAEHLFGLCKHVPNGRE
jgi:hypothetical protein